MFTDIKIINNIFFASGHFNFLNGVIIALYLKRNNKSLCQKWNYIYL